MDINIRDLVGKSAFIDDRLYNPNYKLKENQNEAKMKGRIIAWEKLLNVVPDNDIFGKRLKYSGITKEKAEEICSEYVYDEAAPLPEWALLLEESLKILPIDSAELLKQTAAVPEDIGKPGPLAALFPFVFFVEKKLRESYAEIPLRDLGGIIAARLYLICAQCFNAKAHTDMMTFKIKRDDKNPWKTVQEDLLSGGYAQFLDTYPVLAKRISMAMQFYLTFMKEFLNRLELDMPLLEKEFFGGEKITLTGVKGEISDLHQQGKSVLILSFRLEDGQERRLVYKPRSLEIDVRWEAFAKDFSQGLGEMQVPHALDKGSYGYIEFVENKPCADKKQVEQYFYNAGMVMALMHSFGGNDFHSENIIANGSNPVIIDTETLMIPVARPFSKGGEGKPEKEKAELSLEEMVEKSVIKSGFLPLWTQGDGDSRVDKGALTAVNDTDKNLPLLEGEQQSANSYAKFVSEGFQRMYKQCIAQKEELLTGEKGVNCFKNCKFRMLIRNSQVYGNLLTSILHPSTMQDGFDYSLKTERMVNAYLYEAKENIISELLKVFQSEKTAIENGDIPIFYNQPSGEGIEDEKELLFDRYFNVNAVENSKMHINNLSEKELNLELQIIMRSLSAEARDSHSYFGIQEMKNGESTEKIQILSHEAMFEEAEALFAEIMENRFAVSEDNYSWLAEQYDAARGGTSLNVMGPSLYDGLLGVAVFGAALYKVTSKEEYKKMAQHCTDHACEYLEHILPIMERYNMSLGISGGIGGYIRGLMLVYLYTNHKSAHEMAEKLVKGVSCSMIKKSNQVDVLAGVSGMIQALTDAQDCWQGEKLLVHIEELLKACGEKLLETRNYRIEGFTLWESAMASKPLTGLGHGMSGIAAMLMRLYDIFEDSRYLEAVKDAMAYENSVYVQDALNWPDFRVDPKKPQSDRINFMPGYCSGAPGIGMGRIDMINEKTPEDLNGILQTDVERAEKFVCGLKNEGRNHLCCGAAGRIDFLLQLAEYCSRNGESNRASRCRAAAAEKLSMLIQGKQKRGYYNFHAVEGEYYYNVTLFQGTAGIGYEILRYLYPETIETVLI